MVLLYSGILEDQDQDQEDKEEQNHDETKRTGVVDSS